MQAERTVAPGHHELACECTYNNCHWANGQDVVARLHTVCCHLPCLLVADAAVMLGSLDCVFAEKLGSSEAVTATTSARQLQLHAGSQFNGCSVMKRLCLHTVNNEGHWYSVSTAGVDF